MVAILRCNRDEEKLLWEKSADPNASAKGWVTARPTDNWKGRDVVLIVTSPAARPMITHAGSLRKGSWRGTVLRELSVTGVEELPGPCPMDVLGERVPPYVRKHLEGERTLPDQAGRELLSVLLEMRPEWGAILDRLSEPEPPVQIRGPRGEQVGLVRDAVGLVLQMAGFSREPLELWTPPADLEAPDAPSFLDGLPEGVALEDDLIAHDARRFRDWLGQDTSHHGWRVYTKNGQRLLIGNVNRKPAEATLGVDLIYLNESRQSTVLVQYKKLIKKDGDWSYHPARDRDNLEKELARMRDVAAMCEKVTDENDAYRLHSDPCWFKLCRAESTIPRTDELVQGMYLPRAYFDQLLNAPHSPLRGSRGGLRFGYQTVPRYLDNTTFSGLVQDGWIGSTGRATEIVQAQIRASHAGSREIVFAALLGENPTRAQRARRQRTRVKHR